MSPELFDPEKFNLKDSRQTKHSDRYALGMVIYEVSLVRFSQQAFVYPSQVLTGLRPFHHILACTPVPAVLRGERPKKPLKAECLGFSDALWELTQLCWSESTSTRPTVQELLDHLFPASLDWNPPLVYPAMVIDTLTFTDSDSSDSLGTPPVSSTYEV